jgi:hypothetical protein
VTQVSGEAALGPGSRIERVAHAPHCALMAPLCVKRLLFVPALDEGAPGPRRAQAELRLTAAAAGRR